MYKQVVKDKTKIEETVAVLDVPVDHAQDLGVDLALHGPVVLLELAALVLGVAHFCIALF
jgi:hypothetical protein